MSLPFKLYLTCAKEDLAFAKKLQNALEHYEIPDDLQTSTTTLYPVYLPSKTVSSQLSTAEHKILRQVNTLVVICSSSSASALKINEEIKVFLTYHPKTPIEALVIEKESFYFSDTFPDTLKRELKKKNVTIIDTHKNEKNISEITRKTVASLLSVKEKEIHNKERFLKIKNNLVDMSVIALLVLGIGFLIKTWWLDPVKKVEVHTEQNDTYKPIKPLQDTVLPLTQATLPQEEPKPISSKEQLKKALLLNTQANKYNKENNNTLAKELYHQALRIYNTLNTNNTHHTADIATTYNNLAYISSKEKNYEEAQKHYQTALHLYKTLDTHRYQADIAMIESNLISLYGDMNKPKLATYFYGQARHSYELLAQKKVQQYDISLARVYIMGHYYHLKPTVEVEKIKNMLEKYPESSDAKELLDIFK